MCWFHRVALIPDTRCLLFTFRSGLPGTGRRESADWRQSSPSAIIDLGLQPKRRTTNHLDVSGALPNTITHDINWRLEKGAFACVKRLKRPHGILAPSPLAKLATPTPGFVFLPTSPPTRLTSSSPLSSLSFLLHCLSSLSWNRNQVTHFLISASFLETNTLLQSHSLLKHPNILLLERAGPRFNSRYDLNAPRFIVINTATLSHVCLLRIVGQPKEHDCSIHFESRPLSLAQPM